MTIFKVVLLNRRTGTNTTVYLKSETMDIAHDCAWDRYGYHYDVVSLEQLHVEEPTTNDKPE